MLKKIIFFVQFFSTDCICTEGQTLIHSLSLNFALLLNQRVGYDLIKLKLVLQPIYKIRGKNLDRAECSGEKSYDAARSSRKCDLV